MPWGKMDDKFHRNRKVRKLRRMRGGVEALGVWAYRWSWCLDDVDLTGMVPEDELDERELKAAPKLVEVGLWDEVEGGFRFHDFNEYNPTKEQVERKKERDRQRAAALRAEEKTRNSEQTSKNTGDLELVACDSPANRKRVADESSPARVSPSPSPSHAQPNSDCLQGGPPEASAPASGTGLTKRKPSKPAVSTPAWEAYAAAYQRRYGVAPVRNARVSSQLAQFVQRVPADDAPAVAEHYLASNNSRYVSSGHSVGCLLQDAEKLRTEWATGRHATASQARKADARQERGQMWDGLIARLEREEAEAAANG